MSRPPGWYAKHGVSSRSSDEPGLQVSFAPFHPFTAEGHPVHSRRAAQRGLPARRRRRDGAQGVKRRKTDGPAATKEAASAFDPEQPFELHARQPWADKEVAPAILNEEQIAYLDQVRCCVKTFGASSEYQMEELLPGHQSGDSLLRAQRGVYGHFVGCAGAVVSSRAQLFL